MKIGIYTIDKEGYGIIFRSLFTLAAVIVVLFLLGMGQVKWLMYGVLTFAALLFFLIVRFFRVPDRHMTENYDAVLAPADGTVVAIEKVFVDEYLQEEHIQISIFMSIWNVHANWFPIAGTLEYFKYHPGSFMVANNPKSSTLNERASFVINHRGQRIMFRQIAGYVARRIVSYGKVGQEVRQNQRCGFIKFGSRLDVFVPLDYILNVRLNDKVVATETILALKPEHKR